MTNFCARFNLMEMMLAIGLGFLILFWIIDLIYKPYGKKPTKKSKLEKKIVNSPPFKFGQNILFIIMFIFGLAIVVGLIGPGGGGWLQP